MNNITLEKFLEKGKSDFYFNNAFTNIGASLLFQYLPKSEINLSMMFLYTPKFAELTIKEFSNISDEEMKYSKAVAIYSDKDIVIIKRDILNMLINKKFIKMGLSFYIESLTENELQIYKSKL